MDRKQTNVKTSMRNFFTCTCPFAYNKYTDGRYTCKDIKKFTSYPDRSKNA